MVTRVRIEAEGSSPDEVERILAMAHENVGKASPEVLDILFGAEGTAIDGDGRWAFAHGQAGEFVIERFAREEDGGIVYRGRMTSHYAPPARVVKLGQHLDMDPVAAGPAA